MVPIETEIAGIFGPLLNRDCRYIWSPSRLRLQEYMVPTLTDIAGIIDLPIISFSSATVKYTQHATRSLFSLIS